MSYYGYSKHATMKEIQSWRTTRSRKTKCLACRGTGKLAKERTSFGVWVNTCPTCYGEGKK